MPNTNQATKRIKQDVLKRARNDRRKRSIKDSAREFLTLIKDGKQADAEKMLPKLHKAIDKAGKHNTIHKNKAARQKALYAKMVATKTK